MPRIYTRTGDAGDTGLLGGGRVPKDDPRVEAYGTVDEANSALGLLAAHLDGDVADAVRAMQRTLFVIGAELATPAPGAGPGSAAGSVPDAGPSPGDALGSGPGSASGDATGAGQGSASGGTTNAGPGPASAPGSRPVVGPEHVAALEALIDAWDAALPPLRQFVLPGGSPAAAACHLARAVVRRAERRVVTLARTTPVNPEILRYLNRLSDALFVLARWLNHREGRGDVLWEGRRG
ncbi:MAG: cob(I)yrinic acid a,c-diamide adenosyltransferase [Armatimonadota bacterium]|nr:cob(I)yrinic acid a,c-diamide adenosyltransferase [Armatimonadota bacterium]